MKFKPKYRIKPFEEITEADVAALDYHLLLELYGIGRECPRCRRKAPLDANYCSQCLPAVYLGDRISK